MASDAQRPRDSRLTINKEFGSFDAFIEEYVTNISRSGAFVKTADPPQVEPRGMGVVFTHISHHSQHLLERMLTLRPSTRSDGSEPNT